MLDQIRSICPSYTHREAVLYPLPKQRNIFPKSAEIYFMRSVFDHVLRSTNQPRGKLQIAFLQLAI